MYGTEPKPPQVEQPQPQPASPKRAKKTRRPGGLSLVTALIIVGAAAAGAWLIIGRGSSPIPKNIQSSANFPIYYPSPVPNGYKLDKKSTLFQNGVLFLYFINKDSKISMSQQAIPKNLPDFGLIQKSYTAFKKLDIPAGQALVGVDGASRNPIAIIETNTTLINITGTPNTPLDVTKKLAQNLSSLSP